MMENEIYEWPALRRGHHSRGQHYQEAASQSPLVLVMKTTLNARGSRTLRITMTLVLQHGVHPVRGYLLFICELVNIHYF